ncbi:hypothetical protein EMPG_17345 [Blastomyces silverae]|uniref:Uncharacterized protein n=1 Tax=Blastomyces silverae TaxID=2060906 RepID=A0A0H1B7T9_9EURO|nr:hypothetical protein EMPG_17345 [Blastomyces silverae]
MSASGTDKPLHHHVECRKQISRKDDATCPASMMAIIESLESGDINDKAAAMILYQYDGYHQAP